MINYSKYDVSTLPKSFVAIDFETLYPQRVSACSVGMVKYIDGEKVDNFYTLIRPPFDYPWKCGNVLTWKSFTADLYANLCSKTTSGNLNTAFEVKVNGTAITVADTSFATSQLGFDSNIECWIPSKLGEVSINQGSNTVEITALKTTSIKFSQFAFSSMSAPATISQ